MASSEAILKRMALAAGSGGPWLVRLQEALVNDGGSQALDDPEESNFRTGYSGADVFDGLGGDDILDGRGGADELTGGEGDDALLGGGDGDNLFGGEGQDFLSGERGGDSLSGDAGDDLLDGGRGDDTLTGGDDVDTLNGRSGDDFLDGGTGADVLTGGRGDDTYIVDDVDDALFEGLRGGRDTVESEITWTLGGNFENLELTSSFAVDGFGNGRDNLIKGNSGANNLYGRDGEDRLSGGGGDDMLVGGRGNDRLSGGAGADRFVVQQDSIGQREKDRISDFSVGDGDYLDIATIDADTTQDGDQEFVVVAELTGVAGQMSLSYHKGYTMVRLDVDGDGKADYRLKINGDVTLHTAEWIL